MDDDDQPDFDISYLDEVATAEQKARVIQLETCGWRKSHIFEYRIGELAVWLLQRRRPTEYRKSSGYVHCFVIPSGEIRRYNSTTEKVSRAKTA